MLHYYTYLIQKTMALAVVLFIGFTSNAQVTLNAWDSSGLSGTVADGWQATTVEANMTTGEVSRGPGINAASLTNSFSSNGWDAASLDPDRYFEFFVEPQAGFEQSLNELGIILRRSGTGPSSFQLAYRVGPLGGFTNIGSGFTYTGSQTNGELQGPFDLSGITALQGTTERVTFRLYGWGTTNAGGTLAIGRLAGDDLFITGATAPSGAAVDPEPTNHASALACAAGGQAFSSLDLSWTDATGGQAPAGYLLRWSTTGFGAIADPVDGDAVAGSNDLFIDQGVQTASLTGLDAGTTYFFKLFPYSNAGANIDYKTDGSVPETDCTTTAAPCLSETFTNIPANSSSYLTRTWTGDTGVTFQATDASTNQTINDRAILIRNGALTAAAVNGGASSITLTTQRAFTGGTGNLTVSINGNVVGSIPYNADVQTTTISGLEIGGTYSLEIATPSNGDRIKLDDLFIECFEGDPADILGCTDSSACNFNAIATLDDDSCLFPGDACDDGNPFTYGDVFIAGCGCEGTPYSIVTQWNFNAGNDEANVGVGSISAIGGTSNTGFTSGGGSSDPTQPGSGYQTADFPIQSTNSGQAGIEVAVNTTAYQDISFIFDIRLSNTASRWYQIQYSINGTDFVDFGAPVRIGGNTVNVGSSWFNQLAADFTGVSGVSDNENFKVRVVSVFSDAGSSYESANSTSTYGTSGTWRFDMVTVAGVGFGCTAPTACNYNANATLDDGTCFFVCNNTPETALNVTLTNLNAACSAITLDLEGATSSGQGTVSASNDAWFEFTAVTAGVRIEAATTEFDAIVELLDASLNTVAIEDEVLGNGSEFLNIGNLTPGDQYLVRIATINAPAGAAPVEVCLKFLPATQCDYGSGPYSFCNVFKAQWVGPGNYQFTYTNVETGLVDATFTTSGLTTHILRQAEGLQWGAEYEVTTNVILQLANGAGTMESILVENNNGCAIFIDDAPLTKVRNGFGGMDESSAVQYSPFGIVRADFACEANSYTWSFNDGSFLGDGIEYTKFSAGNILPLGLVGLNPGTYAVRVKATFVDGTETPYGDIRYISILQPTGMATEVEFPVVMMDNDKVIEDELFTAGIAIYPNPNRGDNFNLNISGIEAGTDRVMLDIYDLYGKLVKSEQLAVGGENLNIVVSLDGIADGMYLVNVIMDGKVYTERMIVQK